MTSYYRHRRVRWVPATAFAVAVLVIVLGAGVRIGSAFSQVGDYQPSPSLSACYSPEPRDLEGTP